MARGGGGSSGDDNRMWVNMWAMELAQKVTMEE
jgi:hypothetical protein